MLILTKALKLNAQNKGAIGYFKMSPDMFLKLTSYKRRKAIESEALSLHQYNGFIKSGEIDTMPYLRITPDGQVVAHEGRHRCVAVKEAGGTFVYVALIVMNKAAKSKKDKSAHPIECNVKTLPTIWKAQFSDSEYRIRLVDFKYFAGALMRHHRQTVESQIFAYVEEAFANDKKTVISLQTIQTPEQRKRAALKSIGR